MAFSLSDLITVASIAAIGVGIFVAEELGSFIIRRAVRKAGTGPTVMRDIRAALRVVAAVLILSNVLSLAGFSSLFTTLTISGVIAVAVSLALQTTLSNVISGLFLFSDGAVRLNDRIEYGGIKGKIVRLGLRNTWIKTDSGELAVVSNTSLSGGPLVNHTATVRLSRKYGIE